MQRTIVIAAALALSVAVAPLPVDAAGSGVTVNVAASAPKADWFRPRGALHAASPAAVVWSEVRSTSGLGGETTYWGQLVGDTSVRRAFSHPTPEGTSYPADGDPVLELVGSVAWLRWTGDSYYPGCAGTWFDIASGQSGVAPSAPPGAGTCVAPTGAGYLTETDLT